MDSEMEFEIDLRDMLYRVLLSWRQILRGALIIGLLALVFIFARGFLSNRDEEALQKAESKYRIELSDYEATGEQLAARIENLRDALAKQQAYNENSVLMKIDPMKKAVGSFVIYINADAQIDPKLSLRTTDPNLRFLNAYAGYLSGGELHNAILPQIDTVDEVRFLQELLTDTVDIDSSTITVTCVGKSEDEVRKILTLARQYLNEKYEVYQTTLGEHKIDILTESINTAIDLKLADLQKQNLQKITDYSTQISDLKKKEEAWENTPAPKAKFGMPYVIKQSVKYGIIGCAAGVFVMAAFYAMAYVFSRTMKTDSDWNLFGIPVLGNIWRIAPKRKQTVFERWIEKYIIQKTGLDRFVVEGIGERNWKNDEQTQDRLVVNNLGGVLKEKNLSGATFISLMEEEKARELVANLDQIDSSTACVLAGNVLEDPNTVQKLGDTAAVIVLGQRYKTKIDDIRKVRTLLSAFGKSIIGAVVLEEN